MTPFFLRDPWKRYLQLFVFAVVMYTAFVVLDRLSVQYGWALRFSTNMYTTLLPIILSIVTLDVTYQLGKNQNRIAEQQTEIQKRQCEIEEFDIYKEMHRDVYKLHQQSRLVLPIIYCYFASHTAKDQVKRVEELETVFNELADKISVDEADFVLRKGKNDEILQAYQFACLASFLLGVVPAYVMKDAPEHSEPNLLSKTRRLSRTDEEWGKTIAKYIPNQKSLNATIAKFIEEKNRLFEVEDNLLERIRVAYKNNIE